ncbi:MAG: ATP-dependent helicase [Anaerolineae bacterium]|nr:ATP-dependent helicase [Anaerolineae bacterium]
MFKPRPKQQEVLKYRAGMMGVVAVPGSGKTRTLSYLAAQLVAGSDLQDGQEVLVVTLVNSAVGHFARQVGEFVREKGLLPGLGYRVRTLHGLANDIVRERPTLAGLADSFTIVDEREAGEILHDAAASYVRTHGDLYQHYVTEEQLGNARIQQHDWLEQVKSMAASFIKQAKDTKVTPDTLAEVLKAYGRPLPLAEMCLAIYESYERGLRYRGAVDFQDLIRLALKVLEADPQYLGRLQYRWPYVLEDEAQDSSKLQEEIIRRLVGEDGNWVRVGDPNQAIYETFTTASPEYLRGFLKEKGVVPRELPNSGRSTLSIIRLANRLIEWSLEHPNEDIRARKPLDKPLIEAAPADDPQGNPTDNPAAVQIYAGKLNAEEERNLVVRSVKSWLEHHRDQTAAILLPINASGSKMVDALRAAGVEYVENLRTTTSTRKVVGSVQYILNYLSEPKNPVALAQLYRVYRRDEREDAEAEKEIDMIARKLRTLHRVEDFVEPCLEQDWLEANAPRDDNPVLYDHLQAFRAHVQRWQAAVTLPVDQLVLTVAGDLFTLESDIATAYSLALYLRRYADDHPEARLPEFVGELEAIARNQRPFTGMGDDEEAFDPQKHVGKVAVTTMHKAKGLEWDRVYLMSGSNYDFPSADVYDRFMGEKWFIRDSLNLEAEALGQLKAATRGEAYVEGQATQAARLEYASERLRLLYVGITRARRELTITWNTGKNGDQVEATPIAALRGWWEEAKRS